MKAHRCFHIMEQPAIMDADAKALFDDLRGFPLMHDEFVGAVNNRPYSFN